MVHENTTAGSPYPAARAHPRAVPDRRAPFVPTRTDTCEMHRWIPVDGSLAALAEALERLDGLPPSNGAALAASRPGPRRGAEEPNRRLATDLTTVWTKEDGLVAVVPVIDCGCRSVLTLGVTKPQDSAAVLTPVRHAVAAEFGSVVNVPHGFELRTDHGPQYTGADCEELCRQWNIDHTLAPVGRPTGNAVAERVIRTMKEECIWLRDWTSLKELEAALATWMQGYNEWRPHQALMWQTPSERRAQRLAVPMRMAA